MTNIKLSWTSMAYSEAPRAGAIPSMHRCIVIFFAVDSILQYLFIVLILGDTFALYEKQTSET